MGKIVFMQMSDEQLIKWNQQGLIPGPSETEEEFFNRIEYSFNLQERIDALGVGSACTFSMMIAKGAQTITTKLYDFYPEWVPIGFSNDKLLPWHGGCAWIFQTTDETPKAAYLQLRKEFHEKERIWGLYDRHELVAHEVCHVGRLMFEEPKFEEFLAYQTSSSSFRRRFSPIVESPIESNLFALSLFLVIGLDLYSFMVDSSAFQFALMFHAVPILFILMGLLRLFKKQALYQKCLLNLERTLPQMKNAHAVLFRLTDEEINTFAKFTPQDIQNYRQCQDTLRWRVISAAYF